MKRTMKYLAAGLMVAAIGVGSTAVVGAQGPGGFGPGRMRPGPGGRVPGGPGLMPGLGRMAAELGITDAQRTQIKGVMEQHKAEFQAIRERARTARTELHAAVKTDVVDEALIREKHAAVATIQADMAILGARVRGEVFNLLTPEQQAKAKERRAQREQRMQERQERMQQRRQQRQQQPGGEF
jgi:protein CpxP